MMEVILGPEKGAVPPLLGPVERKRCANHQCWRTGDQDQTELLGLKGSEAYQILTGGILT